MDIAGKDRLGLDKEKGGEDKRKNIKSLIDKIPTSKEELFAFPIDSSLVDSVSATGIAANITLFHVIINLFIFEFILSNSFSYILPFSFCRFPNFCENIPIFFLYK